MTPLARPGCCVCRDTWQMAAASCPVRLSCQFDTTHTTPSTPVRCQPPPTPPPKGNKRISCFNRTLPCARSHRRDHRYIIRCESCIGKLTGHEEQVGSYAPVRLDEGVAHVEPQAGEGPSQHPDQACKVIRLHWGDGVCVFEDILLCLGLCKLCVVRVSVCVSVCGCVLDVLGGMGEKQYVMCEQDSLQLLHALLVLSAQHACAPHS